ncbi:chemotaxis protein CheW [bacterium]|nr:chemotaxis protein CheW [bacterium]
MARKLQKFILFSVGADTYAMPLLADSHFMVCDKTSAIPGVDSKVRGLTYHNGNIITILDTAKILKIKRNSAHNDCLLFNFEDDLYGLLVDEGGETVRVQRSFSDGQKKVFKKYVKINKHTSTPLSAGKVYVLEPEELLGSANIL